MSKIGPQFYCQVAGSLCDNYLGLNISFLWTLIQFSACALNVNIAGCQSTADLQDQLISLTILLFNMKRWL